MVVVVAMGPMLFSFFNNNLKRLHSRFPFMELGIWVGGGRTLCMGPWTHRPWTMDHG
jgi:hypothetical protein